MTLSIILLSVAIKMKAVEQYIDVVAFTMLCETRWF